MTKNPSVVLPGKVDKIIPSYDPKKEDTVQIKVETEHDLYREVRIENTLTDESGERVKLKPGAPVEVTVSADVKDTTVEPSDSEEPHQPVKRG